jgi:hypothetical protein
MCVIKTDASLKNIKAIVKVIRSLINLNDGYLRFSENSIQQNFILRTDALFSELIDNFAKGVCHY